MRWVETTCTRSRSTPRSFASCRQHATSDPSGLPSLPIVAEGRRAGVAGDPDHLFLHDLVEGRNPAGSPARGGRSAPPRPATGRPGPDPAIKARRSMAPFPNFVVARDTRRDAGPRKPAGPGVGSAQSSRPTGGPMPVHIEPANPSRPDFVGNVGGIELAPEPHSRRSGGDRARDGSLRRADLPQPDPGRRRDPARLQPEFRPARTGDRGLRPRRAAPAGDGGERHLQCRPRTAACWPRDDRRRLFGLGNMLWHSDARSRAVPAKYVLSGAGRTAGRAATPSSPTCAPPGTRWTRRRRREIED